MSEQEGRGNFIVIDGNDGSGKTTQLNLLAESLRNDGCDVSTFDFPQYESTIPGQVIAEYVRGEYGDPSSIHPRLITIPYAMDRALAAPDILKALNRGDIALANRYVSSNLAHQSGRFESESEQDEYIEWDMKLEYEQLGIPQEDAVIYLFVPRTKTQELMQNADRSNREYAGGKQVDLVEGDEQYLSNSERAYLRLAEKFDHWTKIICVDDEGKMRSRDDIHLEIRKTLEEKGLIPVK